MAIVKHRHPWVWLMQIEVVLFIALIVLILLFALFYPITAYSRTEPYRVQPESRSYDNEGSLMDNWDRAHQGLERSWARQELRDAQDEMDQASRDYSSGSNVSPSYPSTRYDQMNRAQIRYDRSQRDLQDAQDRLEDDE